ncbi:unnamed protein product [Pylaiella littoralis]
MSRAAMARANFKQYTDITNPLASQEDKRPGSSANTGAWRDSQNPTAGEAEKEEGDAGEEDGEEDEDPFGLGSIMSKTAESNGGQEKDGEDGDEDEDPFGLGAIMDGSNEDKRESVNGKRSSNSNDDSSGSRNKKTQKTTAAAAATTGGYFNGTSSSTPIQSAVAEAKRQPFRAANSFGGAKQGYAFQKGPLGLGYYADKVQIRTAAAAAAAAAAEAASRSKRQGAAEGRDARTGPAAAAAAASAAAGRGDGERRPRTVDVAASVQKLKEHILRPKKTAKAASLMADLMQAQMCPENARMFFRALKPLAEEPGGDAALAAGEGGARAFRLLLERAPEWVAAPAERVRAVTWELLFGLRHDAKTDDSFTFARSIKRLRQAIEALGDVTGGGEATDGAPDEADDGDGDAGTAAATGAGAGGEGRGGRLSLSLERKTAVILIMKEAFKSYHLAWARSSIEPAFKAAADRRRLFPEGELRDTLDGFTDAVTKRQRNPGGLMAPPARSVRAHNSTAHPMLNKRSDVIR